MLHGLAHERRKFTRENPGGGETLVYFGKIEKGMTIIEKKAKGIVQRAELLGIKTSKD